MRYAEVAVPIPLVEAFHYSVPKSVNIEVGAAVKVPVGVRAVTGYVLSFPPPERVSEETPLSRVREIHGIDERNPGLPSRMIPLARWIASRYVAGLGETIETMIPAAARRGASEQEETWVVPLLTRVELTRAIPEITKRARKQAAVVEVMAESVDEALPLGVVLREAAAGREAVSGLVKKGVIRLEKRRVEDEMSLAPPDKTPPPKLTGEQGVALKAVLDGSRSPGTTVLIEGITGSGKTEVYLRAISELVSKGKQAIVLVPEISLTPQTVERFRGRFSKVAILHSQLTDGQRAAHYMAIREGRADVVIGARSAVFAPLPRLGIIVIDEEHENSFKEDTSPRYHAREVAIKRGEVEGAVVVLGSATPSIESLHAARTGKYAYARLTTRPAGGALPPVEIVDMRAEIASRKRYVFISRRLADCAEEVLKAGKQVLLFLNRRGFSTQLYCPICGGVLMCSRCDIPMTYHKNRGKLLCHYCERVEPPPTNCPQCGAAQLLYLGTGTERLEAEMTASLPDARIARLDSDVMEKRGAYFEILSDFRSGEVNVLIGTQVVAKGLDIPGVSLVGVINADVALTMADFRAGERTAQLLCQVAGRAGRRNAEGRVIIQTMSPSNPAVAAAVGHGYHDYAVREIEDRLKWGYPPGRSIARIISQAEDPAAARESLNKIRDALGGNKGSLFADANKPDVEILGPAPCVRERIRNMYRFHLLLKAREQSQISDAVASIISLLKGGKKAHVTIDVDPLNML